MAKTSNTSPKKKSPPAKAGSTVNKKDSTTSGSGGGGGAKGKILELMADSYSREEESISKERLSALTKLAPKTIANVIPKLKAEGLIEEYPDSKSVRLTKEGIEYMGDKAKILSSEEKFQRIKDGMKGKQLQAFEFLSDGQIHTKEALATELGFDQGSKQKGFVNLIGKMRSSKILDYPDKDSVQLCDAFLV